MSGKGKRKDEEEYASDAEGHAPPKKTFKKDFDDSDDIVVCEVR